MRSPLRSSLRRLRSSRTQPDARRHPRGLILTAAALVTLMALGPWLPERSTPDPEAGQSAGAGSSQERSGDDTATARDLSPAARAEIDRVVGQARSTRVSARGDVTGLASGAAPCAQFEGQRYCLGVGFTDRTPEQVAADLATSARRVAARGPSLESTGDLDAAALLRQRAARSPVEQARLDRRELTDAALSAGKLADLESGLDADLATSSTAGTRARATSYPEVSTVMNTKQVRSQRRSYWCGPTTMQMIAWGWDGKPRRQGRWANRLGTTSSGSSITEMVRVVNSYTGWDNANRAGRYITLDIGGYSFKKWYALIQRHIAGYRAPVVLHPILLKRYFPYLDDDASGHFQAGRGYDRNSGGTRKIGYFEPWDQSRFDPSEPYIARVQWRSAYKSFRANKAHFQHNIGV